MKNLEKTSLAVVMQEEGKDAVTRVSFSNVTKEPAEAKILALGEIVTALAPEQTIFESVVKTEQTRYVK